MKLTELDPRWACDADIVIGGVSQHFDGRHGMAISFECPHCRTCRLAVWFANPIDGFPPTDDAKNLWQRQGDSFDNLTLTPSIDASNHGHWHVLHHERGSPLSNKDHDFGSLVCIYAQILPRIRVAAKELGYAIAIHGTLTRDLDLLAVPWIEEAAEPMALVSKIADTVGGYVIGDRTDGRGYVSEHPTEQPHGRKSWNICWGGKVFIDLSVMPRLT